MSFLNPPPSPQAITAVNGGDSSTTTIIVTQPQYGNTDVMNDTSSSSPSPSTSIIIVIIVIASAIIVSATIYLLLRLLSRRCNRTFRTFSTATSAAGDVVLPNTRLSGCLDDRRVANSSVFESLPLFTFGSVTGKLAGGDCAVCLSKFEPQDQLRLLPLCCHAFHAGCIDTWLLSNLTCPLCRSTVNPNDCALLSKILASEVSRGNSNTNSNGNNVNRTGSFRVEIGSVSRREDSGDDRRSYSVGSFDYIVDNAYDVPVGSIHQRGASEHNSVDKESVGITVTGPPGENVAEEVGGNRSWWLRDYVDRLSSFSFSSRTMSFRSSGRFFAGSSRRSDVVVPVDDDLEASRQGEEISEFFRWLSGV